MFKGDHHGVLYLVLLDSCSIHTESTVSERPLTLRLKDLSLFPFLQACTSVGEVVEECCICKGWVVVVKLPGHHQELEISQWNIIAFPSRSSDLY